MFFNIEYALIILKPQGKFIGKSGEG